MHFLLLLVLPFAVSSANEIYRSSVPANRVELAPRDVAPLSPRDQKIAEGRALQRRTQELIDKKELQFMMIFPSGASAAVVDYALEYHAMMPPAVAAVCAADLAQLEIKMAQSYGLPVGRVAREVDVLLELARLNLKKTNALAIQEVLKKNAPTLGAAFQDLFVEALKELPAPSGLVAGDLPTHAMLESVYKNLTRHLNRALASSRRLLRRRPESTVGQVWLNINPPAKLPETCAVQLDQAPTANTAGR